MTPIEDAFEVARSRFKEQLTPKELQQFEATTLGDLKKEISNIQRTQDASKSLMALRRMEGFLEAMTQFGKVIEVYLNTSSFLCFVWGPVKFILLTASTWASSFETVVDAYSQIGEHMPLLKQYENLFGHNDQMQRILALIYEDLLVFHAKALCFFGGKVWQRVFRAMWKDFESRFRRILDSLSRHRRLIAEQANLLFQQQQMADRNQMFNLISHYQNDRENAIEDQRRQEQNDARKSYLEVLQWFSAADTTASDQQGFTREREEYSGTGRWILEDEKVRNWREADAPRSSVLWVTGKPGAGKTILASAVISSCLDDQEKSEDSITAFFYCKEEEPRKNDCISVLRALLSQLLRGCRQLVPYCQERQATSGEVMLTSTTVANSLLGIFLEFLPKVIVIIDGLDELDTSQRKLLLPLLNSHVKHWDEQDPGKLRIMFLSQQAPDIDKALETALRLPLTAEHNLNANDIRIFVKAWCEKISDKYALGSEVEIDIEESTCVRSEGMFLYAKLVMNYLYTLGTREALLNEIQPYRFPIGLEEAYKKIVNRLSRTLQPQQWKITRELLGWMVCAKRQLRWHEIQAAQSINAEDQTIRFEDCKLRDDIQHYCGSLIQVLPGNRVQLIHNTAKMYIRRMEDIRISAVECDLTALCLQYLTFDCFDDEAELGQATLRQFILNGYLAFQDYAISMWSEHVHAVVEILKDTSPDDSDSIPKLERALSDFRCRYDAEIDGQDVCEIAERDCQVYGNEVFYEDLLYIWNHICRHQSKGVIAKDDISLVALREVVKRNRNLMESLPDAEFGSLTEFYGNNRYKCPKLRCFYFSEGFEDMSRRDKHTYRHDRPFRCEVLGCTIAELGYSSNAELERHNRYFHADRVDLSQSFKKPVEPNPSASLECHFCGKRFTRGFSLRNHIRSHTGDRPFACSECGRAFTRSNDRTRHEKTVHRR